MPSSRFSGAAHRASGAVATNTRGGGREASHEIESSRRRTTLDRPEAGGRSADPPRATEGPIVTADGSRLHALDSAAVRLIIHLATEENGSRGRMGSAKKYLDSLPNMTLEERRALASLNDEEASAFASAAERYAKSVGVKGRYGRPGASDPLGALDKFRKPGGGMFDAGGLSGYLSAGSGHGGVGLPGGRTGGGGPDVGGFGSGSPFDMGSYLGAGGSHGGVDLPGGRMGGGGPHIGSFGGGTGGPDGMSGGFGRPQIPGALGNPWRGGADDGTFGYGSGLGSGAQLPNSAWKALHPGGQVSEDPKTPPPPPQDEKKGVDPKVTGLLSQATSKRAPTERPDDRITAAAIGGGAAGAIIGFEKAGPAGIAPGVVFGIVGGVGYTYLSWKLGFRPSDEDAGMGPRGPRARASNQVRGSDAFMPAPDDSGPTGPNARNRGSTFRPADDGSGPAGPVGPRSNTAGAYRDRGGFFLPNPDDPNGPSSPRT